MQSVQIAANSSNVSQATSLSIPVTCHGNSTAGKVPCRSLEAKLVHVWNSRSHVPVTISQQGFTTAADGSGVLSLTLDTRLAGIYVLELASFGARDQLFVRMRQGASVLTQLQDRNAFRNDSYTWCTYDCHARNVSNIGRLHPQEIRVQATDSDGLPLYGAQVMLHYYTTTLQYCYTTTLLHYYTTAILHYYTTTILHYYNTTLLHYYTTILLHYCTTTLLHYYTTTLLHYYTTTTMLLIV